MVNFLVIIKEFKWQLEASKIVNYVKEVITRAPMHASNIKKEDWPGGFSSNILSTPAPYISPRYMSSAFFMFLVYGYTK